LIIGLAREGSFSPAILGLEAEIVVDV